MDPIIIIFIVAIVVVLGFLIYYLVKPEKGGGEEKKEEGEGPEDLEATDAALGSAMPREQDFKMKERLTEEIPSAPTQESAQTQPRAQEPTTEEDLLADSKIEKPESSARPVSSFKAPIGEKPMPKAQIEEPLAPKSQAGEPGQNGDQIGMKL